MKTRTVMVVFVALALNSMPSVLAAPALQAKTPELKRLDPHGSPELKLKEVSIEKETQCKVCHFMKGSKLQTKPEPENICASCHGRLPHSGLVEHTGEEPGGGAGLNCLSCHRAHRATMEGPPKRAPAPSSLLKSKRNSPNLPSGLIEHRNTGGSSAMIDHPCSECHSF
ncbi:MAG TPA: hypothetical protein VJB59_08320 [Bdellovibrionota bacterium]|nr:hypothetical protein [Bdellovibrionota bacterium]